MTRKFLIYLLLTVLLVSFFTQFYNQAYAAPDSYSINLTLDKIYVLRGQNLNVTVQGNFSSATVEFRNATSLVGSYVQNVNTSRLIAINSSYPYGDYSVKAIAGDSSSMTWITVLDITGWTVAMFPYSRTFQNIKYTFFANGTVTAYQGGEVLSIDLSTLRTLGGTWAATSNSMNFRVRYTGTSVLVDLTFAFIWSGCKFVVNGTLDQARYFNFQISNPEKLRRTIEGVKQSNIIFDWSDLSRARQAFSYSDGVLTLSLPQSFSFDPTIFSDGFESGSYSAWTGTTGSPTVQSSIIHHGIYAANFSGATQNCYVQFGTAYTTIYARYYAYVTAISTVAYTSLTHFARSGVGQLFALRVTNNTGVTYWSISTTETGPTYVSKDFASPISLNTWYCIEIKWTNGTSHGAQLWIDGSSLGTNDGTTVTNDCNQLYIEATNLPASSYVYSDCVFVASTYIGPEVPFYPYVEQQSNVDSSADVGTHSSFNAQQAGPDSTNDTLTEANTLASSPSFGNPATSGTSYTSPALNYLSGGMWTSGSTAQTVYNITFFGSETGAGTRSVKSVLCNSSGYIVTNGVGGAVTVSGTTGAWYTSTFATPPTISSSASYALMVVSDSAGFRLFYSSTSGGTEYVDTSNSYTTPTNPTDWSQTNTTNYRIYANTSWATNYRLDIEEQFLNIPSTVYTNKQLCLFMGPYSNTETIYLQGWNYGSSSWTNITGSLTANQWNNMTISGWLNSYSNLTIRFLDGTQSSDASSSNWQKDCCLLYFWNVTNSYSYFTQLTLTFTLTKGASTASYSHGSSLAMTLAATLLKTMSKNTLSSIGLGLALLSSNLWVFSRLSSLVLSPSIERLISWAFSRASAMSLATLFESNFAYSIFIQGTYLLLSSILNLALSLTSTKTIDASFISNIILALTLNGNALMARALAYFSSIPLTLAFNALKSIGATFIGDLALGLTIAGSTLTSRFLAYFSSMILPFAIDSLKAVSFSLSSLINFASSIIGQSVFGYIPGILHIFGSLGLGLSFLGVYPFAAYLENLSAEWLAVGAIICIVVFAPVIAVLAIMLKKNKKLAEHV